VKVDRRLELTDDLAYSDADDDEDGKSAYEHDPRIVLDELHLPSPNK
jgi:hypothetical protein